MPTPVNASSQLKANITSLNADESQVTPFSMVDLLGTTTERDTGSPAVVALASQDASPQESSDDAEEPNGAEWLAYWSLSPITMPIESLPAQQQMSQIEQGTECALDDGTLINQLMNPLVDSLHQPAAGPLLAEHQSAETLTAAPSSAVDPSSREQEMLHSLSMDPQSIAQHAVESQASAASLSPMTNTQEQRLMSALMQNTTSMSPEGQEQTSGQPVTPETKTTVPQAMVMQPILNDIISKNQRAIDEETIKKPLPPSREIQTSETSSVKRQVPTTSASDLFTPSTVSENAYGIEALASNQIDLSHSATTTQQVLTDNLNNFLTQGMAPVQAGSNEPSLLSKAPAFDAPGQITMELISMQPEPLAHGVGLNLEQYTAQIKVHPQELGQITAKIEVNNGIATISFMTEHAHVKQLMEANLPELRQAFQHSSLQLHDVDVHHGGSQDKKESPVYADRDDEEDGVLDKIANKATDSRSVKTNRSIIDTYA